VVENHYKLVVETTLFQKKHMRESKKIMQKFALTSFWKKHMFEMHFSTSLRNQYMAFQLKAILLAILLVTF